LISACQTSPQQNQDGAENDISYLAKTDIDTVTDTHYRSAQAHLMTLAVKLYRRNPRYCQAAAGLDSCVKKISAHRTSDTLAQRCPNGLECMKQALEQDFSGDRIELLVAGMQRMIDASYNFKSSFYITDQLDGQKLYNSARNIEIVVWRMKHHIDKHGKVLILSNGTGRGVENLSFERLFGKLISLQDTMATIVNEQQHRLVKNIIQRLATAVFLPI
jgi:hypothetical protein